MSPDQATAAAQLTRRLSVIILLLLPSALSETFNPKAFCISSLGPSITIPHAINGISVSFFSFDYQDFIALEFIKGRKDIM